MIGYVVLLLVWGSLVLFLFLVTGLVRACRVMVLFKDLPEPDEFGNYWLGARGHGPAILHSKLDGQRRWFVSTDNGDGLIRTDSGHGIRYFTSPEDALAALRQLRRSKR